MFTIAFMNLVCLYKHEIIIIIISCLYKQTVEVKYVHLIIIIKCTYLTSTGSVRYLYVILSFPASLQKCNINIFPIKKCHGINSIYGMNE